MQHPAQTRILTPVAQSVRFSFVVPTFGRPDEVSEFLESLHQLPDTDFEVIIADGTPKESLEKEVGKYAGKYPLTFYYREYLPVSDARNEGAALAQGEFLIFLDSDCIIPPGYLQAVKTGLARDNWDEFGGPDAADTSFTPVQKAISYSMTSLFTTGGIRGNKNHVGKFHPRGFNMGIRKTVFDEVQGYSTDFRCGEDIELSIRIRKAGHRVGLIPEAFVYHKRRTDFGKFFKQVFRFGAARINLHHRHREEMKLTHAFPFAFLCFVALTPFTFWPCWIIGAGWMGCLGIYSLAILADASVKTGSFSIGLLSVRAAYTQLLGYGWGFARNGWEVWIKGNKKGLNL